MKNLYKNDEKLIKNVSLKKKNDKGKIQDRIIILTDKNVQNIENLEKPISKRKIEIDKINKIICSNSTTDFLICVENEHDYQLISNEKDELMSNIMKLNSEIEFQNIKENILDQYRVSKKNEFRKSIDKNYKINQFKQNTRDIDKNNIDDEFINQLLS